MKMSTHPTNKTLPYAFGHLLYQITLCIALIPIACSFDWHDKKKHNIFGQDRPPLTLFGHLATVLFGLLALPNWLIYQICSRLEKAIRWCLRCQNKTSVLTGNDLMVKLMMWPVYTATALLLLVPAVLIKSIELSVRFAIALCKGLYYLLKSLITTSLSSLLVKKEDTSSNLATTSSHTDSNPSKKLGNHPIPENNKLDNTDKKEPEQNDACTAADKPKGP